MSASTAIQYKVKRIDALLPNNDKEYTLQTGILSNYEDTVQYLPAWAEIKIVEATADEISLLLEE